MLGCVVILAALRIWAPLPLLTSCVFLSPCRLAGAWSYWCHCHRLPPGYVRARSFGRHHTEKVLSLLNSIKKYFCYTTGLSPALSCLPGALREMVPWIWEKHCRPCAGQPGCLNCSMSLVCVYLLGDADLAGPVNPTQEEPVAVCGFGLGAQKGPSGSG